MRHAANVDVNQQEIVLQLRQCGVVVKCMHAVGGGFPDLVCGYRGRTILLEIKHGSDKLTQQQQEWHGSWSGQVAVVRSFDEAMDAILQACK